MIDWDLARDCVTTFFDESGAGAFFPLKGGRWCAMATAADALGPEPTLAGLSELLAKRTGRAVPMRDASWIAPFRIHHRQVDAYRHGRVFLAGDAAHIHSPIGGQGMNTGMQDAHNLAWKLALVQRGRVRPEVLDSYHVERHAIGAHVLRQTDAATKLGMLHGVASSVRNQVARFLTAFEPVRRRILRDGAELTVAYEDSPIVGEHVASVLKARIGHAAAGESPTVASHLAFRGGPRAGTRMLDGAVVRDGETTRLARAIDTRAFTLLLFDGRDASGAGYAHLVAIARAARERWGDLVASWIVTPRTARPAEVPADIGVLLDPAGELEARYAASTECAYVVRPDLYVGFRSQPADAAAIAAHLDRLLVATPKT